MTAVYEPKNILITGGAGFIASHVAEHLFFKYPKYKRLGISGKGMDQNFRSSDSRVCSFLVLTCINHPILEMPIFDPYPIYPNIIRV